MERKILIGIAFFVFWTQLVFGQTFEIRRSPDWERLDPKQKATAEFLLNGIAQEFQKTLEKERRIGTKFKGVNLSVDIGGEPKKGNLVIEVTLLIIEPNRCTWILTKDWSKCPAPNSPEIEATIKWIVEAVIFQLKIPPLKIPL